MCKVFPKALKQTHPENTYHKYGQEQGIYQAICKENTQRKKKQNQKRLEL